MKRRRVWTCVNADKDEDSEPDAHTNGVSKDPEEDVTEAETDEAIAPELESKEALDNKIGTTVERDKEAESTNVDEEAKSTNLETDEPNIESAPEEKRHMSLHRPTCTYC